MANTYIHRTLKFHIFHERRWRTETKSIKKDRSSEDTTWMTCRNSETLQIFQKKIKLWQTDDCPCRLCKVYISQLGFI